MKQLLCLILELSLSAAAEPKLKLPPELLPLVSLQADNVVNLRCEYLKDPLGMDVARPRLSWVIAAPQSEIKRGIRQTAYQVLVASTPACWAPLFCSTC
jgi:hypothetical protein